MAQLQDIVPGGSGKSGNIIRWIIIVMIVVVLITAAYQIYKASKTAGDAAGEIAGADIIQAKTGISKDRQRVCRTVAADCENAVVRVPLFGTAIWVKDEDVVNALNRLVSSDEAALTCVFFREISGESLKSIVEGGMFVEKNRVRITYRSSLV